MATNILETKIAKIAMRNPLVLASGIWGVDSATMVAAARAGAGAVTSKSCNLEGRNGHRNPTVIANEHYMLNAVGLPNPGATEEVEVLKKTVLESKVPVIASIFAETTEKFGEVAEIISRAKPAMIEINVSCPNVEEEMGKPFACSAISTEKVVAAVKNATKLPVSVKLSPNVSDIKEIAKSAEEAGADAITAINTSGGMLIDIEMKRPVLANRFGGMSGPALKPIALKSVYEVYSAVEIPIIGTGGITNANDAIEMIMAGATCAGIGSAIYYEGVAVFPKVSAGIEKWLKEHGYSSIKEIIGAAHE